jgi:thioredoxin reductase (NADPH)
MIDPIEDPLPVAIVGAGPIGLELAVNLKANGVKVIHFESQAPAQTINRYPKNTEFFSSSDKISICGIPMDPDPHPTKEAYVGYLRRVARHFQLELHTQEDISQITKIDQGFLLTSQTPPYKYKARAVVLATGNMNHQRRLGLPGEDKAHVRHSLSDPDQYAGRSVLVIGGRNSAVETALRCHRSGAHVSISYRGPSFDNGSVKPWLFNELREAIGNHKLNSYLRTVPLSIQEDQVQLKSLMTGAQNAISAQDVLIQVGYRMDNRLIRSLNAKTYHLGSQWVVALSSQTMESSIPGLYVIGTAAAGCQNQTRLFIENAHSHVVRVTRALTGKDPRFINQLGYEQFESSRQRVDAIQHDLRSSATTLNAPAKEII